MTTFRKPKAQITRRQIAAIHSFYAPAFGKEGPDVPKARAKPRDLEHPEQVQVIRWWRKYHGTFGLPEISLFAIPNANKRTQRGGDRLKQEGMRAGVSDLFLAANLFPWGGAFCEMKSEEGTLSVSQSTFLYAMEMEGYQTAVCYSAREAIEFFKNYLGEPHGL